MKKLDKLASNRFHHDNVGQEATTYVIEKLSDDNWATLSGFTGNAKPTTFLHSISCNLLEEFSRKRFGRLRPPQWIQKEGGIWLKVWKMICLERQPIPMVIDTLCKGEKRQADFVNSVVKTIKGRLPWCGVKFKLIPVEHTDTHDDDTALLSSSGSLEYDIDKQHLEEKLTLFAELLENADCPSNTNSKTEFKENSAIFFELQSKLDTSEEDMLVLRMAFSEGLKLNVIAQALGMPAYQPGRILKRIFKDINTILSQANVHVDELSTLLAEVEL